MLYLNDRPSAYSIYFTMNHMTGYWRTAYDPGLQVYSSGKLMLFNLLQESFERQDTTFDFMHGLEKYKFLWTEQVQNLTHAIFYRHPLYAMLANWQAQRRAAKPDSHPRTNGSLPIPASTETQAEPSEQRPVV